MMGLHYKGGGGYQTVKEEDRHNHFVIKYTL